MDAIDVRGLRIAFERQGTGPPLVLLHGFVGHSREWHRQIEALSDAYTVVAWDAPGAGRSSDPPETFRLPDYADCLADFIDGLGLTRPHVAGLSFGGALALELYGRHPTVPASLIVASGYAGWAGSLGLEVTEQRLRATLEAADAPSEKRVQSMIPGMFSGSPPPDSVEEFRGIMSDIHPDGLRAMARSLAEADLRDVLPRITVPTLLLYGDQDSRAPLAVADGIHAAIPESRLVVMHGVGHVSSVEAPGRFTAEVREFLDSLQR